MRGEEGYKGGGRRVAAEMLEQRALEISGGGQWDA